MPDIPALAPVATQVPVTISPPVLESQPIPKAVKSVAITTLPCPVLLPAQCLESESLPTRQSALVVEASRPLGPTTVPVTIFVRIEAIQIAESERLQQESVVEVSTPGAPSFCTKTADACVKAQDEAQSKSTEESSSARQSIDDDLGAEAVDAFNSLSIDDAQYGTFSSYSRDSLSIYFSTSSVASCGSSIYSNASSLYSSTSSVYSADDIDLRDIYWSASLGLERPRPVVRQPGPQDAAVRERSSLAKKAALFKNSVLKPELPAFQTTLSTWSMVCHAARASLKEGNLKPFTGKSQQTTKIKSAANLLGTAKDERLFVVGGGKRLFIFNDVNCRAEKCGLCEKTRGVSVCRIVWYAVL